MRASQITKERIHASDHPALPSRPIADDAIYRILNDGAVGTILTVKNDGIDAAPANRITEGPAT